MADVGMPDRPESSKAVKEFMLIEGEDKIVKQWKDGDSTTVVRGPKDTDGEHRRSFLTWT